jgi:hypothetical protein
MSEETQIAEPVSAETLDDIQRDDKGNTARDRWLKGGSDEIPAVEKPKIVTPEPKHKQKGPEDTEKRFQELLADRKKEKERADKLEADIAELKKVRAEVKTEPVAEIKEPERPKRPRRAEFASDELYEAALDKHETSLLEYPAKKAAFDAAKAENDKSKAAQDEFSKSQLAKWTSIKAKSEELFGADFWKEAQPLNFHPFVWNYLQDYADNEIVAKILNHFVEQPKELERINKLTAKEKTKALDEIESSLTEEHKEETEKKEDKKSDVKVITQAKKPPAEIGGRGSTPTDEEDAALEEYKKTGDSTRMRDLANRRALTERKRGMR